jgi:FtsZ-binding cell division protein ZapB
MIPESPPTLAPTMVSAEKQLTMPPQKKSKKNTPTETDQEDHYNEQDNRISFTAEPSQTTYQEWRAKHEALQKARAEKTTHTLESFAEEDANEDDDQAVDRELERVQHLQKKNKRFANQLEAKRKVSEKLEKLNQAKEQIERMQREIEEMKEQENNSLWQDSPHQNSGQNKMRTMCGSRTGGWSLPCVMSELTTLCGLILG